MSLQNRFKPLSQSPIFVLGNQKAGTTAIAAILAVATRLSVTQDFFFRLPVRELESLFLGKGDFSHFISTHRVPFSRDIIKDNSLTFFLPALRKNFPNAQYLFIIRDPRDNIRSILNRLGIPGGLSSLSQEEISKAYVNPIWGWLIEGKWPPTQGRTYIEKMAHRWNLATKVFLDSPDTIPFVKYEDFRHDKQVTIKRTAAELGLDSPGKIAHILDRPFQKPGDNSATWLEFFGGENLSTIETICGPIMCDFGYKPST
jgi:hypothetical protein